MLPFSPSIDLTDQLVHHLFQLLVLTHICSARDRHLPCNSSDVPHTLSRNSVNTFPRKYSFQKLSQHFIKKILFWGTRSTLNQENTLSSLFQNGEDNYHLKQHNSFQELREIRKKTFKGSEPVVDHTFTFSRFHHYLLFNHCWSQKWCSRKPVDQALGVVKPVNSKDHLE